MFPEPGNGLGLIIVGVKSLPFLEIKTSLGHLLEWVSLLGLSWKICLWLGFLFLLFFLLLRLHVFLLGGLLFLLFLSVTLAGELSKLLGVKLCHFGTQGHLSQDSLHIGLIDNSGEPSGHVDEGLPEGGLQHLLVEAEHGAGHGNVTRWF